MNHLIIAEIQVLIYNNVSYVDLGNISESRHPEMEAEAGVVKERLHTDPSLVFPAVADPQC